MNNFQKRISMEIAVALFIIAALGSGIFLFGSDIKKNTGEVLQLREILFKSSDTINRLAQLKKDYDGKAKNYLSVLYNKVPFKDQLINLPREFKFLASPTGLQFGFAFGDELSGNDKNLPAVKFTINVAGELDRVFKFLKSLGQFRYLNTLDSVTVGSQDSIASMTIVGRVFFR